MPFVTMAQEAKTTSADSSHTTPLEQKKKTTNSSLTLNVNITGIKNGLLINVQNFLTLERRKKSNDLSVRKIRQWFKKSEEEIRSALQPFGFYQPQIKSQLNREQYSWTAQFNINPGTPTLVDQLNIEVLETPLNIPALDQAIKTFRPQKGTVLNHIQYKESKDTLYRTLLDAGYLDARFDQATITVQPQSAQAKITIRIHPGPRYYFGHTQIKQSILNEAFIKKFNVIPFGQPFNTQQVINQKLLLDDSQYFASVEPFPQKDQAIDNHIPIIIETTPMRPRRYTLGMGYGTDTGPRVNGAIEFRRINAKGHKVDTSSLISGILQNASLRYRIPFKDVRTDEIALSTRAEKEEIDSNTSTRMVLGIERSETWLSLRRKLYIETTLENYETASRKEFARVITPGTELIHQRLNNAFFPTRGHRLQADLRFSSTALHSSVDFQRLFLSAGTIYPLSAKARLILRGEAGYLATNDFSEVPPTQRFYAGGARNVRAYGYRELGASDSEGSATGGSQYVFGSIEADALIRGNFGLAIFYDAGSTYDIGNLADDTTITNTDKVLKTALGLGFRWRSPAGMLRLDFASPLKEEIKRLQIHFSIGSDL